jgi:hypothetical protein
MNLESKGQSPFYPGQPVPVELFVGREAEIERIDRAARQVALGRQQAVFIEGEYGIGKSSLALYMRTLLEQDPGLLGFHVLLGECKTIDDLSVAMVKAVATSSRAYKPAAFDRVRGVIADYIGEQTLFGVRLHLEKLRQDAPSISVGFLPFCREIFKRAGEDFKGLLLIFDEINGLASKPEFSHFLKNLYDENALSGETLPLFLVLCGTRERRQEIVSCHPPVARIFEIAEIAPMDQGEMENFFKRAFEKAGMSLAPEALETFGHFSGGLPKLMHLIGDAAFYLAQQSRIDLQIAWRAVVAAAAEVGRKFVDPQVYDALHSKDYHRILDKLSSLDFDLSFSKNEVAKGLSQEEKKKFDNFLQRMKKLKVLVSGAERGEYVFCDRLTRLYLEFRNLEPKK